MLSFHSHQYDNHTHYNQDKPADQEVQVSTCNVLHAHCTNIAFSDAVITRYTVTAKAIQYCMKDDDKPTLQPHKPSSHIHQNKDHLFIYTLKKHMTCY